MSISKMRAAQEYGAKKRQIKLLIGLVALASIALMGGGIYVAGHFVIKYW